VIYTTNAVESLNMSLRKALKTRVAFPSENAALKVMYLSLRNLIAKWERPLKWKAVPEPVHPALGRSDTDRDQSVILVTHFAPDRNRCGWRGPPSRLSDELAPFGNDGGPRQPNNSNYPGHKGNKQKRTCPDHRGNNLGNGVYTKSQTLPSTAIHCSSEA